MNPNTPHKQGTPASFTQVRIDLLSKEYEQYRELLMPNFTLIRATIVIAGRNGRELVNKVISFPPGSFPPEFAAFLESYANGLVSQKLALESSVSLINVYGKVIALEDFLNEYTTGEIPSIDGEDVVLLKNLIPGQHATIKVNGEPVPVQKLS
jgi:hypothetical protein